MISLCYLCVSVSASLTLESLKSGAGRDDCFKTKSSYCNEYTRNNKVTVGRVVFYAVHVVANTPNVVKRK
jgi:hypothetical protein